MNQCCTLAEDVQKYNEDRLKKQLEKMTMDDDEEEEEAKNTDVVARKPSSATSKLENKLENIKVTTDSEDDLETEVSHEITEEGTKLKYRECSFSTPANLSKSKCGTRHRTPLH